MWTRLITYAIGINIISWFVHSPGMSTSALLRPQQPHSRLLSRPRPEYEVLAAAEIKQYDGGGGGGGVRQECECSLCRGQEDYCLTGSSSDVGLCCESLSL